MQNQPEVPASVSPPPANTLATPNAQAPIAAAGSVPLVPPSTPVAWPTPQTAAGSWKSEVMLRVGAWAHYKPVRIGLVLLALFTIGWPIVNKLSNGMPGQMIVNYGYQYHFKFYTHAVPTTLEGEAALATKQGVFALGSPTKSSLVADCADMGRSWSQAFEATINGTTYPVCGRADGDTYTYNAYFSAAGTTHLFSVIYSISVAQAAKRTPDTAKLQAIFNSVQVSPQPQN